MPRVHYRAYGTPLVVGSGIVRERIMTAPNFAHLRVSGMFRATFFVDPDFHDDVTLRIRADDNVLRRVQARLRDGVLHIYLDRGNYRDLSELSVAARVGNLRELAGSGTSHVLLEGACRGPLKLSSSAASQIHARGSAQAWHIESSGASHVRVALGQAERVEVAAGDASEVTLDGSTDLLTLKGYGTASVHAKTATEARVELAGLSSARIAARRSVCGRVQFPCQLSVACPGTVEIAGAYRSE